jgi:hypothetical protein
LHVRKKFFDAAQDKNIREEKTLLSYMKDNNISWKSMDEKTVFLSLSTQIRENNIKATPTCTIKYPGKDIQTFIGDEEIWNGLSELKKNLTKIKK